MNFEKEVRDGVLVLRVGEANFNFTVAVAFRGYAREALEESGAARLVLDLAPVEFVDSLGVGMIAAVAAGLKSRGGGVAIANASSIVRTAMEAVRLETVVSFHESVEAAIRSGK
ncbi:MAG: STAS domain-containing protein [bacterium]